MMGAVGDPFPQDDPHARRIDPVYTVRAFGGKGETVLFWHTGAHRGTPGLFLPKFASAL